MFVNVCKRNQTHPLAAKCGQMILNEKCLNAPKLGLHKISISISKYLNIEPKLDISI